jgi:Ran GTPase-activating protein (RanGAP) involved in mRNA processing and transport
LNWQRQKLILDQCSIGIKGVAALVEALRKNKSLVRLDLDRNRAIGDAGARVLADTLARSNTTLKELSLVECGIVGDGAAALGWVLSLNVTLEKLSLGYNDIWNHGAIDVANGLANNNNLKRLELYGCGIFDREVAALGEALKTNKSLEMLDLRLNILIGREDVDALANGLSWNTSLVQLYLPDVADTNRIECYLQANRFVMMAYREREPEAIFYKLWPLIYAKVSNHPAALHMLLKETNMNELISNQLLPGATQRF